MKHLTAMWTCNQGIFFLKIGKEYDFVIMSRTQTLHELQNTSDTFSVTNAKVILRLRHLENVIDMDKDDKTTIIGVCSDEISGNSMYTIYL